MLLPLNQCLVLLKWWCKVRVSVEVVFGELDGLDLHSLHLLEVLLVVQTVAEHVAKGA